MSAVPRAELPSTFDPLYPFLVRASGFVRSVESCAFGFSTFASAAIRASVAATASTGRSAATWGLTVSALPRFLARTLGNLGRFSTGCGCAYPHSVHICVSFRCRRPSLDVSPGTRGTIHITHSASCIRNHSGRAWVSGGEISDSFCPQSGMYGEIVLRASTALFEYATNARECTAASAGDRMAARAAALRCSARALASSMVYHVIEYTPSYHAWPASVFDTRADGAARPRHCSPDAVMYANSSPVFD